jgi:hypothetical protein
MIIRTSVCRHVATASLGALLACGTEHQDRSAEPEPEPEATMTLAEQPPRRAPPAPLPIFNALPGGRTPNDLRLPRDFLDWSVIGVADRTDDGTIRVIIGNDVAVRAARYGFTHPWPEGSMISQLVWTSGDNPDAPNTVTPAEFSALTLMVKDTAAFSADGGWAYGAWSGPDLLPPSDPAFDRNCVNCHTSRVKQNDYVFTRPGRLPSDAAFAARLPAPNGLAIPPDFRDWHVIGVSRPSDGTIRVIVGNQVAVDAARAGQTDPWPTRTMLAHYSWLAADNPDAPESVVPGDFAAVTLMLRRGDEYAFDGGWQYGLWSGPLLTPPADALFDRPCVNCHTGLVSDQDFVFTQPGPVPVVGLPLQVD